MYRTIWEFEVDPSNQEAFESMYGPTGDWVDLFKDYEGYVKTQLFADRAVPQRYITVDIWDSETAYQKFLETAVADYAALGKRGLALVRYMTHIGTSV